MKIIFSFLVLVLVSCAQESSPEGRSIIRDEEILRQVDSLRSQISEMRDSIKKINSKLDKLERN